MLWTELTGSPLANGHQSTVVRPSRGTSHKKYSKYALKEEKYSVILELNLSLFRARILPTPLSISNKSV